MNRKQSAMQELYHGVWIVGGALLFALAYNLFYAPNSIAMGGLTGIAMIVNKLFGFPPVGVLIILLNVPLFISGWKFIGSEFLFRSLYGMLVSSVMIDVFAGAFTFTPMDPLLASLYGGLLSGVAFGVIFRQGGSTGGSDIAIRLLKLKLGHLPMGQLMLIIDLCVIVLSALVFGTINSALYGLVALYVCSIVMDRVLYGLNKDKFAYIISNRPKDIADAIIRDLDRGVTLLQGQGAYSGADKRVLLCAFKNRQIVALKQLVKEIDPDAFLIVSEAYEVFGEGFAENKKNSL